MDSAQSSAPGNPPFPGMPVPPAPPAAPVPPAPPSAALGSSVVSPHPGFGTLLQRAFGIWKIQWWRMGLVGFLPVLALTLVFGIWFVLGPTERAIVRSQSPLIYLLTLLLMACLIFLVWISIRAGVTQMQLVAGADERIGVQEAWRRSKGKTRSVFWLGLISFLVIFGGITLFVVPGIILGVSLSLCMWVLVRDGIRGSDALVRSAQLVKGDWWWTAGSIFALFLFLSTIMAPVSFLEMSVEKGSVAWFAVSFLRGNINILLTVPLALAFFYALYESLSARKSAALPTLPHAKKIYVAAAVVGIIMPFILVASMANMAIRFLRGAALYASTKGELRSGAPELDALMQVGDVPAVAEADSVAGSRDADSDADGLLDEAEASLGLDPVSADTDGDGLADGDEQTLLGTHATNADTDGDGYGDGEEILAGFSPSFAGESLSASTRAIYVKYLESGRFHEPTIATLAPLVR